MPFKTSRLMGFGPFCAPGRRQDPLLYAKRGSRNGTKTRRIANDGRRIPFSVCDSGGELFGSALRGAADSIAASLGALRLAIRWLVASGPDATQTRSTARSRRARAGFDPRGLHATAGVAGGCGRLVGCGLPICLIRSCPGAAGQHKMSLLGSAGLAPSSRDILHCLGQPAPGHARIRQRGALADFVWCLSPLGDGTTAYLSEADDRGAGVGENAPPPPPRSLRLRTNASVPVPQGS